MRVLVVNGPNLGLLGTREPDVYGRATLADVTQALDGLAVTLGVTLEHFQSEHEGALVERVHQAASAGVHGAVVNAGGYAHTSIALRDAFVGTGLRFVEVHVSNVYAREDFRHKSLLADVSAGVVVGFGPSGYELALRGLVARLG